ncbi:MAG TPA: AsmA family protein, partial [Desulfatiglandales bacterium]|nr:AsmA family protein [Desulfatiglandales bacterium]
SQAAGRPFSIGGDLRLSLFPWAVIGLSDVHLGNPPGYKEKDMLYVKSFDVEVKLLPLISKDVQVKRFVLDGLRLNMEKNKEGRGNWEGIGKTPDKGPPAPPKDTTRKPEEKTEGAFPLKSLEVGEFAVKNASFLYLDQGTGEKREISGLMLTLQDVSLDRPIRLMLTALLDNQLLSVEGSLGPVGREFSAAKIPLDLTLKAFKEVNVGLKGNVVAATQQFDLGLQVSPFSPRKVFSAMGKPFPVTTSDPEALTKVALKAAVKGSPDRVSLSQGALDLDESKLNFSLDAKEFSKPDISFDLNLDKINVDRYLPPSSQKSAAKEEKGKAAPAASKKTDYAPLRKMVVNGTAKIGMLTAMGAKVEDVNVKISGKNGIIHVDPLTAKAYQGGVSAKTALDVRQDVPKTTVDFQTKGVQAGPLLRDVMKKDFLEGTANADASIQMEGDDPEVIKRTLDGKGQFLFTEGAIKGIDLAGMARDAKAMVGLSKDVGQKPKTDFSELNAPFTITKGLVNTTATTMESPLLRVHAAGKANLVDESLDLRVETKLVGSLKGQGDTKQREGITVPILVTGTFSSPNFTPDMKGIAEKAIQDRLLAPQGGQATEGKTKDILKGLPFMKK